MNQINDLEMYLRERFDTSSKVKNKRNKQPPDEIILLQKGVKKYVLGILNNLGVKENSCKGNELSTGRRGSFDIIGKDNKRYRFLDFKGIEELMAIEDRLEMNISFISGSDVLVKDRIKGYYIEEMGRVDGKDVWGSDTDLMIFGNKKSLKKLVKGKTPDVVYTRGKPIITEMALEKVYGKKKTKKINIISVNSNTERLAYEDRKEHPDEIIIGIEIVQSGTSLRETKNMVLGEEGIYSPDRGDDGSFDLYKYMKLSNKASKLIRAVNTKVDLVIGKTKKKKKNNI